MDVIDLDSEDRNNMNDGLFAEPSDVKTTLDSSFSNAMYGLSAAHGTSGVVEDQQRSSVALAVIPSSETVKLDLISE